MKTIFKPIKRLPFRRRLQPIVELAHPKLIINEISKLENSGNRILETGQYAVYFAPYDDIPGIMHNIGCLREYTFRHVGEGTNLPIDIDPYDKLYRHLILWDKLHQTIVGAYRIGLGVDVFPKHGLKGFYVPSLFVVRKQAEKLFASGIELGRAFIVPEYQQKPLPLYLLWQGIRQVIERYPEHKYIVGCVSISNAFSKKSKSLMISYLRRHHFDYTLTPYIKPRRPFVLKGNLNELNRELDGIDSNIKALDQLISKQQPDGLHVPILLKKYLRQNAKLVAFNVDRRFNHCLDGFMYIAIENLPKE